MNNWFSFLDWHCMMFAKVLREIDFCPRCDLAVFLEDGLEATTKEWPILIFSLLVFLVNLLAANMATVRGK